MGVNPGYDFLEIFAGQRAVTRAWFLACTPTHLVCDSRSVAGYFTASFDRSFNQKTMDFLKPAGFLQLALKCFRSIGDLPEALFVGNPWHGAQLDGHDGP